MTGLKNLFEAHYIEVPKAKTNVLKQLAQKVVELDKTNNALLEENMKLRRTQKSIARNQIVEEVSRGLSKLQSDKLKSISSGLLFEDAKSFRKAISDIRESFVNSKSESNKRVLTESALDASDANTNDGNSTTSSNEIEEIARAITRNTPKG